MTEAEKKIWYRVRNKQLGVHPPLNPLPLRAGNKTIEIFTKVVAILVALMIVSKPITLSAQMITPEDICRQAKIDAHKDVNGCLWFSVVFLGYPMISIVELYPPPARYIGMPPDYVALYTKCYKKEEKKIQLSNALIGCIISTGVWVIIFH